MQQVIYFGAGMDAVKQVLAIDLHLGGAFVGLAFDQTVYNLVQLIAQFGHHLVARHEDETARGALPPFNTNIAINSIPLR